ncbi:family 43 glycosylhydrolase [Sphingomonas daechungensis]|uniref:family 43 glycosylhydrolase n=1 Tax=Sphingomonas daechungensis TaxID=1176646 RepID=UPI001CB96DD6|nr:family 43 glycosylhydrolase [Sphingomonas daechungensis]
MRSFGVLAGCCVALLGSSANAEKRTYINPVDVDYRYNWEQTNNGISYRTGADPAIVRHKGAYYLFQTLADGYWRSTNLIDWTFITPSRWPFGGIVAPAVASDGDRLIIWPSMSFTRPGSILVTTAPETGKLDFLARSMPDLPGAVDDKYLEKMKPGEIPPGPWDPGLLKDDDGRWYLYWNSSNVFPIYGIEIAFEDGKLIYKGKPTTLFNLQPEKHGWERFGQDHNGLLANGQPTRPYVEGAWVTKHNGKYYLQYGAPGTEFNVYGNGTYVSDKPLGPFTYAEYNPIAYKPGGFVQGPATALPSRTITGTGGTPARRGSATIGRSSGGSTCSRPSSRRTVRCGRPRASRTSRSTCRRRRSTTRTACSPAGCCCPTASRLRPLRPSASSWPNRSPTKIRAPSGSQPPTRPAKR